jgi:hypothetical protein
MKEHDIERSVECSRPLSALKKTHKFCALVLTIDNVDVAMCNSKRQMQFSIFSNDKRP